MRTRFMFNKLFTFEIKNCRHLPLNLFNVNIKDKLIFFTILLTLCLVVKKVISKLLAEVLPR